MTSLLTLVNALLQNKWRQSFGHEICSISITLWWHVHSFYPCPERLWLLLLCQNLLILAIPSIPNTISPALYHHSNQFQPTHSNHVNISPNNFPSCNFTIDVLEYHPQFAHLEAFPYCTLTPRSFCCLDIHPDYDKLPSYAHKHMKITPSNNIMQILHILR